MKILLIALLAIVAVLVVAGVLVGPKLAAMAGAGAGAETAVRAQPAEVRPLVETVAAPGSIEPHTKVEISAEVSARIESLPFDEGDRVRKGDEIVRLDARDLEAALDGATARRDMESSRQDAERAQLRSIENTLEFARRQRDRQRALYESKDVSRKSLDDAEERVLELELSLQATRHSISMIENSLAAAEAEIARARKDLSNTTIAAPIDGVITELNAEVGEVVLVGTMNNPGTVIMTLADLGRMIVTAQIDETDVTRLAEGQPATVHISGYPDEPFSGTLRHIALQRTSQPDGTGFFRAEVELDLHGRRVRSGHAANVDIEIAAHEGVVVESQAVVERDVEKLPSEIRRSPLVDRRKKTVSVVYRVVDGRAVATPVQAGPSDLTHTLIERGLDAGELVVVGPYKVLESIAHDDAVTIEDDAAPESGEAATRPDGGGAGADDDAEARAPRGARAA